MAGTENSIVLILLLEFSVYLFPTAHKAQMTEPVLDLSTGNFQTTIRIHVVVGRRWLEEFLLTELQDFSVDF